MHADLPACDEVSNTQAATLLMPQKKDAEPGEAQRPQPLTRGGYFPEGREIVACGYTNVLADWSISDIWAILLCPGGKPGFMHLIDRL